ncbi:MAG: RNB domain-containing ribonuclease [Candidatus Micrarchaeota archaeon]|nr:RNB domain-containing ribonuclease [Candidatus Micrarchaeota archaeon]
MGRHHNHHSNGREGQRHRNERGRGSFSFRPTPHDQDRPSRSTGPVDLKAIAKKAMMKFDFEPIFPSPVMSAVNALDGRAPERAEKSVRDLRGLLWSSIDNFDTEDLDQIEYCEQGKNGEIHVKVAIADVDVYVPKNSMLDMHARKNTTSVYTGIETFPMLPDRLSKNLSSLPPEQDRLAMAIEFTVLPNGSVRRGLIYPALVRNKAKLVYEEVGAWLEGTGPTPKLIAEDSVLEAQIRLQNTASLRLGKYRMTQGALELQSLEARAVIEGEKVLGLVLIEENLARHIIENFMIGANGIMSGHLEHANIPTIQRVVRVPKDWPDIMKLAKAKGTILPHSPNARALSIFLAKQRQADPELFPDLSLTIVKLIGNGEYVMFDRKNPIGHFCLAVTSYTHSTAPNRRYVDLIIQRLVKASLKGERSPYGKKELEQAAEWCTDREHASKKVERFMVKAEAATLLLGKIGLTFDAIITGASDKGIYARLLEPPVEGKVVKWVKGLKVGQKVRVKLINLDPPNGFIDLEIK